LSLKDRPKLQLRLTLAVAASVAALVCAGCSTTVIDAIPAWAGGEPAGAPQRPATAAEYPPVNDRPPARDTKLITEQEQSKIEGELTTVRNAQAVQAQDMQKDRAEVLANTPQLTAAQAKAAAARAARDKAKASDPRPN
jgi:hypothetical protein